MLRSLVGSEMCIRGRYGGREDTAMDDFLSSRGTRYVPVAKKRQKNAELKIRSRYKKLKTSAQEGVAKAVGSGGEGAEPPRKRTKRARVDPLAKAHQAAKAEAEVARAEQARKLEEVRARKAQIRVNRREKKDTSRKLNQRTKWGQPIMKHHMDNILKKLEGEAKN
eukprot:TRINITY_DN9838_c0_g1_i5.p2 TRINITY_DN9838_c0_g1~~TRINITY_DN9838_c0_g1_i5.p2  ORF type:complete len:166 (-),score=45.66 TRINITY_DN9838_c0_g1_i5:351-848(-)